MTQSKISKWFKRGAFSMIACAAVMMVSAEQANAQYYGRGFNNGFGRSGLSINIGTGGFNRGFGGGFNSFNVVPQRSYYRGNNSFYRGNNNFYRGNNNFYRGNNSYYRGNNGFNNFNRYRY